MPTASPLPPGFTVRPATLADVDALTALMAASAQAAIGEDDITAHEVRDGLQRQYLDLAHDTFLVLDDEGSAVGHGVVEDEHPERAFVDVYLSPALTPDDYRQLGGWLAARCVDRAEELVRASGRSGVRLGAGCYRDETALVEVLGTAGFERVRTFWRMSLDLDDTHLDAPALPRGVTIRRVEVDVPADAALAHRLNAQAFREHFGDVEHPLETYWADLRAESAFDPTQWWLAEVDGVPAGLLYGDNRRAHDNVGWVRSLGVLAEFRGRGVGGALLRHACADLRRRGRAQVMLAVDSENATGATAVYESIGMVPVLVTDAYQLTLPRVPPQHPHPPIPPQGTPHPAL